MEKINGLTSKNIVQQNIEKLKEIFPTAFSEGKLVVDELQALVGEYIQKDKEFYQMTWAGKTEAQREANKVSTGTLRPCKEESKDWNNTQNLFIEGDNLEVLKLLQKTYNGKVKMIYIDPPYNTGKDFVYKDNYKDNLSNYLELTNQISDNGKKLSTNSETDGRYHSNWLNMMYPRLKLARNLMTEDGVIFISIDDNEQSNLKKICDEIFGEENFVSNIIWYKRYAASNDAKGIPSMHDHILMYQKSNLFERNLLPRTSKQDNLYKYDSNDGKGLWRSDNLTVKTVSENYLYEIVNPTTKKSYLPTQGRSWLTNRETIQKWIDEGRVFFGQKGDGAPQLKRYLNEVQQGIIPTSLWTYDEVGHTDFSRKELKSIFETSAPFDNPKPTTLLRKIIQISCSSDSLIMDFFAGSGTTGHSVMALNAEDGGKRKCISVQLPETTDEKSEAFKAGFGTISEITKERLRRAGKLIISQNKDKNYIDKLDVGFRVFKLDSSNIQAWDTSVDEFEGQLDMFAENNGDHIKSNRTEEDVLFEILLKYGLELTLPIEEKVIGECKIYNIGFGSMYICLSDQIKIDVATTIGEWHKESSDINPSVIFKDSGFANDADKTNTVQTLRQAGIENVKSI